MSLERLVSPLSPYGKEGTCETCKCWLYYMKKEMVITGGHVVTLEHFESAKRQMTLDGHGALAIKQLSDARQFTQAPCTLMPQWVMRESDMWCWQYSAADKHAIHSVDEPLP